MAESSSSVVAEGPHQPLKFRFPSRSFGQKKEMRSFQKSWFEQWPWLHYLESSDTLADESAIVAST